MSKTPQQTGKLTIVPTPLGNLGDITQRAIEALRDADIVCAEDTRVTGKLLAALGIQTRLERLDENLMGSRAGRIAQRVANGERIAYCSDAGMPGVSDPGLRLVAAARDAGVPVEVLPGPSAAVTAYAASGFTCPHYYFGGFFPRKQGERKQLLESLAQLPAVLLFYESANRLPAALRAIADAYPSRRVAVCRELTKLHEEVACDLAPVLAERFAQRAAEQGIRGEIVIAVDAPNVEEQASREEAAQQEAAVRARELAAEGMRAKDIAKLLAAECGIPRNAAYELALKATS